MTSFRSYLAPRSELPWETIHLDTRESHHLVTVRRAQPGDRVSVFDGLGNEWDCILEEASTKTARLHIRSHRQACQPHCAITLAQTLLKGKAMEFVVEKATELGASRIVPLVTARSEVHLSSDRGESKIKKWRATTIESCKQSGNLFLPTITPIQSLQKFCQSLASYGLKLLAAAKEEAISPRQAYADHFAASQATSPNEAIWLIGPEGDFTDEEYILACKSGFRPVTLGPTVLRAETAAIAALTILTYELRESIKTLLPASRSGR